MSQADIQDAANVNPLEVEYDQRLGHTLDRRLRDLVDALNRNTVDFGCIVPSVGFGCFEGVQSSTYIPDSNPMRSVEAWGAQEGVVDSICWSSSEI
jgi:hypothetical protein